MKVVDVNHPTYPNQLVMLVSAFFLAGRELVLDAYQHVIQERYRFSSLATLIPIRNLY